MSQLLIGVGVTSNAIYSKRIIPTFHFNWNKSSYHIILSLNRHKPAMPKLLIPILKKCIRNYSCVFLFPIQPLLPHPSKLFQNEPQPHNAHKSSTSCRLTYLRLQHTWVVSFFYTHKNLLVNSINTWLRTVRSLIKFLDWFIFQTKNTLYNTS